MSKKKNRKCFPTCHDITTSWEALSLYFWHNNAQSHAKKQCQENSNQNHVKKEEEEVLPIGCNIAASREALPLLLFCDAKNITKMLPNRLRSWSARKHLCSFFICFRKLTLRWWELSSCRLLSVGLSLTY